MFWQNQAGTRPGVRTDWRGTSQRPHLRPAGTAALPWTSRLGAAGAGVSVGPVHGGSRPQPAPALLANSRMCGILNLRSAGIWTERRHGHHTRHAPKGLLNPPRRSLDRLSGSGLPAAHVLGPGGPQLKCKQPVGQFPRPVQKSALPNVQRHSPSRTARSGGVLTHLPHSGAPLGPLAGPARCLSHWVPAAIEGGSGSFWPIAAARVLEASKGRSEPCPSPAHLGQRE
jgi:hypothetical protein